MSKLNALRASFTSKNVRLAALAIIPWLIDKMDKVNTLFDFSDKWPRLQEIASNTADIAKYSVAEYGWTACKILVTATAFWLWWRDRLRSRQWWLPINPNYVADRDAIDGTWKLGPVISNETILVVTGDTVTTELLDRVIAVRIRDEINSLGQGFPKRRAIVVASPILNDARMAANREVINKCPKIFVGGPNSNGSTKGFLELPEAKKEPTFPLGSGWGLYLDHEGVPKVALWGDKYADTEAAALKYIAAPKDGLADFTKNCWGRAPVVATRKAG